MSAKKVYTGELPHSLQAGEHPVKACCIVSRVNVCCFQNIMAKRSNGPMTAALHCK